MSYSSFPAQEPKACRYGTMAELREALGNVTIRSGLSWDMGSVNPHELFPVYHLVLPEGMTAPGGPALTVLNHLCFGDAQ